MIIRHKFESCYTVLPNALLQNQDLRLGDKGLLAFMLSLPKDWSFSAADLAALTGADRSTISASVKRIEAAGYIVRGKQTRGSNGKMSRADWTVSDIPLLENPATAAPLHASPLREKPLPEKPLPVNPAVQSNIVQRNRQRRSYKQQTHAPPSQRNAQSKTLKGAVTEEELLDEIDKLMQLEGMGSA